MTGHVDAQGEIEVFEERGKNLYLQVKVPSDCSQYLVDKGCIAVDGCSLTVCGAPRRVFCHLADTSYLDQDKLDGTQTR